MVVLKLEMISVIHSYCRKCYLNARIVSECQSEFIINELTAYDQNKSGQAPVVKMATSYIQGEQRTEIQFCFESGMTPLDILN